MNLWGGRDSLLSLTSHRLQSRRVVNATSIVRWHLGECRQSRAFERARTRQRHLVTISRQVYITCLGPPSPWTSRILATTAFFEGNRSYTVSRGPKWNTALEKRLCWRRSAAFLRRPPPNFRSWSDDWPSAVRARQSTGRIPGRNQTSRNTRRLPSAGSKPRSRKSPVETRRRGRRPAGRRGGD